MRKSILIFILSLLSFSSFAQAPSMQQRLYYTCKVWGFIKYYHSNVSTCHVNWDSVLVSTLPAVENATTSNAFNDVLDTMLKAAGPMQIAADYFPDTLPAELKRNRDWNWIDNSGFRNDVQTQLDTIKNNFRPHANCYVADNGFNSDGSYTVSNMGWLVFPDDSIELNINTNSNYPDENHRLLILFKYWNIIKYFNPYNYVLDVSWDTTLYSYVLPFSTVSDANSLYLLYNRMTTNLNDAHVEALSGSETQFQPPGYWWPKILLTYADDKYIVARSEIAGIHVGDMLISADGLTPTQWEDSLRPYISAGNISVFKRSMYQDMLGRTNYNEHETLVIADSTGASNTFNVTCTGSYYYDSLYATYYYPADTLTSIEWTTMPCDIGYINIGNLQYDDVIDIYVALYQKSNIIVDVRNYPADGGGAPFLLAALMYAQPTVFAKLTYPDATYPGTFFWYNDTLGFSDYTTPYNGKLIILMNEITQSSAEFDCMMLSAVPNAVRVGSQTAGADGNVNFWKLTQDLTAGFTGLGVYYPNGDSTQRIGIVPDSIVHPTQAGIRHHDDEVLDKALQIAGCNLAVSNTKAIAPVFRVYPNPAEDVINIEGANIEGDKAAVIITDLLGKTIISMERSIDNQQLNTPVNIKALPAGIYIVNIKTDKGEYITKVVK